ncbi:DUF300-domain-containing protein [Phlebopus sp. FC_14]|nr:DUF300-domain-containing protein [Phlebopus sp. FC_14]
MGILPDLHYGHGAGSSLPFPVLLLSGISTLVAVIVSGLSIWLQLRNYRKPFLQRMVVRIMLMVPIYAVASLISLFSLEAAFFIDVIRDVYEAFVIYCFFVLLLDYLGGERALLILLHGRPPIPAIFPVSLWRHEIDASDPYTYLFLKRGILQYVQVKPLLALASLTMKATGTYNEGDFRARSGYLYVSIIYNASICLALWCLAVFWMCVNQDLKPFRPVPKFLCVKGILFFSFWQSIAVSTLVAIGVITRLGPYTDSEHISLGLTDTLICLEMPFFAAAHLYAFSYRDFTKPHPSTSTKEGAPVYVARMRLGYAFRDAFGLKDLVEDTRATLRGEGINYRAFEPSEGGMHVGAARERRIRAGLRYAAGGKRKYWLPEVRGPGAAYTEGNGRSVFERLIGGDEGDGTAPLFAQHADDVVHYAPDMQYTQGAGRIPGDDIDVDDDDEYALRFSDTLAGPDGADEVLYEHAKKYVFGDYLYPVVDVSSEEARHAMWEEEARIVREGVSVGPSRPRIGSTSGIGYGATQNARRVAKTYEDDEDEGFASDERVVDFGERMSWNNDRGGTKLGWTKTQNKAYVQDSSANSASNAGLPNSLRPSPSGSISRLQRTSSSMRSSIPSEGRLHAPPMSPSNRSSSSQHHIPSPLSRLHVPSLSPRPSHPKSPRTPLASDDAVDLIVTTTNNLNAPSTSHTLHSPHSPALIRVWDQDRGPTPTLPEINNELPLEEDHRFLLTVDDAESDVQKEDGDVPELEDAEHIVRMQTPPPFARVDEYQFGGSEREDHHNPWA